VVGGAGAAAGARISEKSSGPSNRPPPLIAY
jgi:hypothetical protein